VTGIPRSVGLVGLPQQTGRDPQDPLDTNCVPHEPQPSPAQHENGGGASSRPANPRQTWRGKGDV